MNDEMTLDAAMRRIESIIRELEKPNTEFAHAVDIYGEAAKLLVFCYKELENGKTEITQISEELNKARAIYDHSDGLAE